MKKIRFLLALGALFFNSHFLSAAAPQPWNEPDAFAVTVIEYDAGFKITGSFLYLQPSTSNLGWGVVTDFLPSITPNWHIKTIEPDFHPAFHVGAAYYLPNSGLNTQLGWTHLNSHDSQSENVTPGVQEISPFSQMGLGLLTSAKANAKFHFDAINWDISTFLNIGADMQMRLFTGLSGVRIKQDLNSTFTDPTGVSIISLDTTTDYWGVGPRFGFDCSYEFCGGFNFLGKVAGGLLFGNMQPSEYKFSGSSAALQAIGIDVNREKISSKKVSQTVPFIDAKIGLNYVYYACGYILTFETGYMGAIYIRPLSGYESNTNILPLEIGALSTNSMRHVQGDFSVNGPYASLSVKF